MYKAFTFHLSFDCNILRKKNAAILLRPMENVGLIRDLTCASLYLKRFMFIEYASMVLVDSLFVFIRMPIDKKASAIFIFKVIDDFSICTCDFLSYLEKQELTVMSRETLTVVLTPPCVF